MEIEYKINNTFAQVHNCRDPLIFVMGPLGSGKSSGCIFHALFNAFRQNPQADGVRRSKHAVIRATYPALRSTTIPTWISWFKDKIKITYTTPIEGLLRFDLDDGTKVEMQLVFMSADDEMSIQKLRSLELTSAHINEANEVVEDVLQMLIGRVNRYPAKKDGGPVNPFIILDYNAISTDHWLYKLAEENKPEGYSFFRQPPAVIRDPDGTYRVNPEAENLEHLPENYYEYQLLSANDDFISVNLMNNYGDSRFGKPVYKDYSDEYHLSKTKLKPLRGVTTVIGVDQGLTPAAVFMQQCPDGTIIIFDEITTEDCSLREFCEELLWPKIRVEYPDILKNFYLVCDPAAAQRSMNDAKAGVDIFREHGFKVHLAKTNVFTERKEAVTSFLRMRNKFKIDPKCTMLRKGFLSEYKYGEVRSGHTKYYKDRPEKNDYSHVHDALQYAVLECYNRRTSPKLYQKVKEARARKQYVAGSTIGGY